MSLTMEEWLKSLSLLQYLPNFKENLFTSMERVAAIWDDELTSILEINKIGHRKRILLSVAGREGMPNRFGKVATVGTKIILTILARVEIFRKSTACH